MCGRENRYVDRVVLMVGEIFMLPSTGNKRGMSTTKVMITVTRRVNRTDYRHGGKEREREWEMERERERWRERERERESTTPRNVCTHSFSI